MLDKPFKTIEEQIELIKSRGLMIFDEERAKQILMDIPYYSLLNGYKDLFKHPIKKDLYNPSASFELFYYVYLIDLQFNSIVLKYILMIEKSLKAKVSYVVAKNIGASQIDYMDSRNYSNRNNKLRSTLSQLQEVINDCRSGTPTKYYKDNKNHIPPWILTNDIMFGLVQQWYSILPADSKIEVCNKFFSSKYESFDLQEKQQLLSNGLDLLRAFRNKAAHGGRTFNFKQSHKTINNTIYSFTSEKTIKLSEYRSTEIGKNDFFSILIIITLFLNEPISLQQWFDELNSIEHTINSQKIIDRQGYQVFNLPSNFIERLENLVV
ncbi:Abi family protein [Enterococcus wangshanyuanii]|uniref:Abortive infection bacteriophage resistance protein n=1 Tax=Enterococcus wangshanyuanii TaxID=2005703 RepID=A0ABQ1PSL3_9ENTE|nr:Abi family protein [Enterococcus wangshanyuanii]GGD02440.1 hypothetical protein GCM10011573_34830 [Enterococcus wangshanyuanii]